MVEWKQLSEIHIQIHPAPLHLNLEAPPLHRDTLWRSVH